MARVPVSASRPYDGVLAILIDGARPDVMAQMAAAGELPVLKRHFVDAGGFRHATGVFPSVSGPAHLPILTGAHPGRANLPGIRWAERPRGPRGNFLGRTRSYMAPGRVGKLMRDIPAGVTTLFQHIEGLADVNTWFVRGTAARPWRTRAGKVAAFCRSLITKDWYSSDTQAERAVLRAIDRGHRSVSAVFPAVDELGHRFGPLCDASYEAYRRFDAVLGRLLDALARKGRASGTLVMLTSDHGQTSTHTHVDIDDLVATIYPRTLSYPKLWRYLFSADAAVMVSGNSLANVYVRGTRGWAERPDFEATGSQAADLCARLVAHPSIDHVIHRRGTGRVFVIVGPSGNAIVDAGDADDLSAPLPPGATVGYTVEGQDPLGYGALPARMTRAEIAEQTAGSAYPDAPWQIVEFFRASRAGDLVVCAKPGYDLRSRFEYQPHLGSHGCLHRQHIMVPAAINAGWGGERLRSVDLFPTILTALGKPVPRDIDGEAVAILRT